MKFSIPCNFKQNTRTRYSFLWSRCENLAVPDRYHFNAMQEVIPEKIIRGKVGLDMGCGCGWDTWIMAKSNPNVKILGMDISDGVDNAFKLSKSISNVDIVRGAVEDIPLKAQTCDFVYSFGVLHHTADYKRSFLEIARILKKDAACFLYLYEDHSENVIKYAAVKIIGRLRKITIGIPPKLLYTLCLLLSPFVFLLFSLPAKILMKFNVTRNLADAMPFNFGRGPFSLDPDLYDRFSAPIEHRFSRQDIYDMLMENNFYNINITRLKTSAGWVAWGYKK